MKRSVLLFLSLVILMVGQCAFCKDVIEKKVEIVPAFSQLIKDKNSVWVGTFQLVWNDFSENLIKGPVYFKNTKSLMADELNKKTFDKSMLSENSYYTAWGETSLALKNRIEADIIEKFNEKSDLLDMIDWTNPNNAYLFYAMLKKQFDYEKRFSSLGKFSFNSSKEKYDYFGIKKQKSKDNIAGVKVLFYNSAFDYAVELTSVNDSVILYRTTSNKNFSDVYKILNKKSAKYRGNKQFAKGDELKVPYLSFKDMVSFDELCGKEILNHDRLYIGKALQTVDFNLTNSGVRLKSEAILNVMNMSLLKEEKVRKIGRNFAFDRPFYIFLKENDKNIPYFAAKINDMSLFKYTGDVN
jgi:hypothetical protein